MTSANPASVPSTRWTEITAIWRDNRWLFALSGWLLGILTIVALQRLNTDIASLLHDLVPEAVSIVFTALILERFAASRAVQERKLALFRQAKSRSNDAALEAVDQILHEGWWDELLDYHIGNEGWTIGRVNLENVQWAGGIHLLEVHLENAFLVDAHLESANLAHAHLQNADMRLVHLENANLYAAYMKNTNLHHAYLENAYLEYANMENANLSLTRLENASLREAHLENADLFGANLRGVKHIETAFFSTKTMLPDADIIGRDVNGKFIFDKYWTPNTDMTRYTNPDHPDFWEPKWVKKEREQQQNKSG